MPARPDEPLVSVVLCRRDPAEPLRGTLEGLCRQTLARDAFEVIVVDDGSSGGVVEAARAFERRLPLRVSRQRAAGIASARNHGLFCATGVLALFLDDGVPEPDLLEVHVATHRRFPEQRFAVVGEARPAPGHEDDPLLAFLAQAHDLEWRRGAPPPGELRGFTHLAAGRASLKRRFLLQRGVFHHAFRSCGEDVELAWRLSRHGLEVVHAEAAVTRVEGPGLEAIRARCRDAGAAAALLARRHDAPEVRALAAVEGAAAAWRALGPLEESMLRSARELDRLVRLRLDEGLPVEDEERALLHRSYRAALTAARVRGIAEAGAEERGGGEPRHRTAGQITAPNTALRSWRE